MSRPKGFKHSTETKQKMSDAWKKREPLSLKARENLRCAQLGKIVSVKTRKKMSDAQKGEKHHNWKGGISFEPYCPKFNNEFRERVRAFFGYTCQLCGHVWQPGQRRHSVHHVNYKKDACCDPNIKPLFVPLCTSCHGKVDFDREYWQQYFTELITNKYKGRCYTPDDSHNRDDGIS